MSGFLRPLKQEGVFIVEMYTTKLLAEWYGPFTDVTTATDLAMRLGTTSNDYMDFFIHQV